MEYVSTNEVFEAIKGQIEQEVGDSLDDVVIYEGTLSEAIAESAATHRRGDRFVFITMTDTLPGATSGYGLPVRGEILVDIYLIHRVTGRGKYGKIREDFMDTSDALVYDVFLNDRRHSEFKNAVHGTRFILRSRQPASGDAMSHLIRFSMNAARR